MFRHKPARHELHLLILLSQIKKRKKVIFFLKSRDSDFWLYYLCFAPFQFEIALLKHKWHVLCTAGHIKIEAVLPVLVPQTSYADLWSPVRWSPTDSTGAGDTPSAVPYSALTGFMFKLSHGFPLKRESINILSQANQIFSLSKKSH